MRAMMARLRGPHLTPGQRVEAALARPLTYADALREGHAIARNLGLIPAFGPFEQVWSSVADIVRTSYAKGWVACESRMSSRDIADAIDGAMRTPSAVVERLPGESVNGHVVRAIQHAVAYGAKP